MRSFLLLIVLVFILLTSPAGAEPVRVGSEFQVNTYTLNSQGDPSIAVTPKGDFLIVWESFGQDGSIFGIFGQRYDAQGNPVGPEFQINEHTTGNQFTPSAASDTSGNFVVVWESGGQDGSGYGIFGRRLGSDGMPLGPEFQVNTETFDDQLTPAVAIGPDGEFVVAWTSYTSGEADVFARMFDPSGDPVDDAFPVNTYTPLGQGVFPEGVAVSDSGDFIVVWESQQDGSGLGIFGQRFGADGVPMGPEFLVNTQTLSTQHHASVTFDHLGRFVVVWDSFTQDGYSWGVFGQRFGADGSPIGAEFQVNVETNSGQVSGGVVSDPSGGFIVVWYSVIGDGSQEGIFARRYRSNGAAHGSEFQVNTYTTGEQNLPTIDVDASGNFVITWYSFAQDGSDVGIFGQRFACSPRPGVVTDLFVDLDAGGSDLILTWTGGANTDSYQIYEDTDPDGGFSTMMGTSEAGTSETMIEVPGGDMVYLLMAGWNATCGRGPLR